MTAAPSVDFSIRLLDWWGRHGRKDLPWQHPRTPYRVWVSEIMLQQTQVATVIPYFERWMDSFPGISDLADASQDAVLAHWAGLGYYARARNLHKTARICMESHDGGLPLDANELAELPGIGRSTANAIVSQATGRPAPVLDGNVRRVLARHAAIEGWSGKSAVQNRLWREAEARLPRDRGDDYTQAIMDLGALVCTRSNPMCPGCPVRQDCLARQGGMTELLPSRKPATRVKDLTLYLMIIGDQDGRILLEKRPQNGIWGGLWSLPAEESIEDVETRLGVRFREKRELPAMEHRLSHIRMTLRPVAGTADASDKVKCTGPAEWFGPEAQAALGLPKPVASLLTQWNDGAFE